MLISRSFGIITGCVALCCVTFAKAEPTNMKWETEVIASDLRDTTIMYSLVAVGFFRGKWGKDFRSLRDDWLKRHPKASIVPVVEYSGPEQVPHSRVTFVWMVQGGDNLIIDLIRSGCLLTEYVKVSPDATIMVAPGTYTRFLEEASAAERVAQTAKLGVWAKHHEEDDDD